MAEETPKSVTRAENFFDILSLANSYADGRDITGLEAFLKRAVKGKAQVLAGRMAKRPSKIVSESVRNNINKAQAVLEAHEKNERLKPEDREPILASNTVTPADASKMDGVIIKEVAATAKLASESKNTDVRKLMDGREHDRESEKGGKAKILPGNMHTEVSQMFSSTPILKEVSIDADDELHQLYGGV